MVLHLVCYFQRNSQFQGPLLGLSNHNSPRSVAQRANVRILPVAEYVNSSNESGNWGNNHRVDPVGPAIHQTSAETLLTPKAPPRLWTSDIWDFQELGSVQSQCPVMLGESDQFPSTVETAATASSGKAGRKMKPLWFHQAAAWWVLPPGLWVCDPAEV